HFPAVPQLEVGELLGIVFGAEENKVGLLGILFGLGALDRAVHDGPVSFQAFPAAQILAVEQRDPAIGPGGGDFGLRLILTEGGGRQNGECGNDESTGHGFSLLFRLPYITTAVEDVTQSSLLSLDRAVGRGRRRLPPVAGVPVRNQELRRLQARAAPLLR